MDSIVVGNRVGTHLIVNVYDVPNPLHLQYVHNGLPLLQQIVRNLNLHVMTHTGYQFDPTGYTYVYVLSESHFSIHTYPEFRSCYIDIFCCNTTFNPFEAIDSIKSAFNTDNVRYEVIHR